MSMKALIGHSSMFHQTKDRKGRRQILGVSLVISCLCLLLSWGQASATVDSSDSDLDGYPDRVEISAGSNPTSAVSTPEVCDGIDNDKDGKIDEGYHDTDGDKIADCVDPDDDNDGIPDNSDDCSLVEEDSNDIEHVQKNEVDDDGDHTCDSLDKDDDNDGVDDEQEIELGSNSLNANSKPEVPDGIDNNGNGLIDEGAPDTDKDGQIDYVDTDDDNDGVPDVSDNCILASNTTQTDTDGDGSGNACDCAPNDPAISPLAHDDSDDGIDQDCNGKEHEIPVSMALTSDQRYPWADYNAVTGEYLVAWQDKRNGADDDIYAIRLDRNGNKIGFDFPVSIATGHQQRALVKAEGGGYLVLWHDMRNQATNGVDIYGVWIAGDGTVGPEMAICNCSGDQWNPVAAYDPMTNTFLVVFLDGRGSGTGNDIYDLWGAVIPAGGTAPVTPPFPMVTEAGGQRGPQIAYDYENSRYYMVWNDRRGVDYDIYGSRVTVTGTLLDGTGVLLSGATGNQFRPTVTDRRPAAGINNHLVAWTDYRSGAQADVYGVYVDGNGAIVGSEIVLSSNAPNQANIVADVDWIGTQSTIIGLISEQQLAGNFDIFNLQIDPNTGIVSESPLAGVATGDMDDQRSEVVVFTTDGVNDYGYLAVWSDRRNGVDYDIYALKIWPH